MLKPCLVALLLVTCTALLGQASGQRGERGVPSGAAGGRGGAVPDRTATGFGTTNTLTTIPEAGAGSAADDPTTEQLAASAEAQAIIANARKIAGTDLAREVSQFCT